MSERPNDKRPPSCLWPFFVFVVVVVLLILLTMNLYRPDSPIPTIAPGSSAGPSFVVQVIRPREGLPIGGLLPPQWFGVDAELGFDSNSFNSSYSLENGLLHLSGADWELRLVRDAAGQFQSESEVVFDLVFEDQTRRVRCKLGVPPLGTFQTSEIASDEFSGEFVMELPICEDAETGRSLGWPPKPFILRGSFDRLPKVEVPE